jgi:signal transduction histidine kinase
MEKIVSQLLAFSRPTPIVMKPENLNRIIEDTIAFVEVNLTKKQINLVKTLDPAIPALDLDALHLKEALVNLFLNSIKAITTKEMARKKREIRIRTEKHILKTILRDENIGNIEGQNLNEAFEMEQREIVLKKGTLCVLIEIEDNGDGIDPDHLKHIFEPFFTTVSGGTGLGLPMVKRTINAHRGVINVDSKKGAGTIIRIYLPIAKQSHNYEEN